ncbi:phosphoribosylanthranilate isomerase [Pontibacter rugosus]|uniref:N-(5'-phosphoribosyl)anthranilate isomerase n=1 Tax=Pontibacter rugosus TaxID=1745966 RepID=A0ABW3ST45_9BACT
MGLRTSVIVNGINNLSDARYCAGMGVDIIGFNLKLDDPERVKPDTLKEIAGWVAGVKLGGEFLRARPDLINELADEFNLNYIQLDIPYLIDEIEEINRPVIQKVFINKDTVESELLEMMELYSSVVHAFIIFSDDFTTVDETNTRFLSDICDKFNVYIGFGVDKDNISSVLQNIKPAGIGLQGGHEIKPGLKDFDELADIFEEIEEA